MEYELGSCMEYELGSDALPIEAPGHPHFALFHTPLLLVLLVTQREREREEGGGGLYLFVWPLAVTCGILPDKDTVRVISRCTK